MWPIPVKAVPVLTQLTRGLPRLLGTNLVGLYAYGSLLDSGFDPARSDIDCIAVTERALDEAAFERLGAWLTDAAAEEPWFVRLQMPVLIKRNVLVEDRAACLYQFGVLSRSGSDGNPIIWMDFFWRGRTLLGPDPESFVPKITAEMLHQALVRELGYLREEIVGKPESEWRDVPSYRGYAVLTLCRILYSSSTGEITSKPLAAAWALDRTPTEWHSLIRRALAVDENSQLQDLPLSRIGALIGYVQGQLDRETRRQAR